MWDQIVRCIVDRKCSSRSRSRKTHTSDGKNVVTTLSFKGMRGGVWQGGGVFEIIGHVENVNCQQDLTLLSPYSSPPPSLQTQYPGHRGNIRLTRSLGLLPTSPKVSYVLRIFCLALGNLIFVRRQSGRDFLKTKCHPWMVIASAQQAVKFIKPYLQFSMRSLDLVTSRQHGVYSMYVCGCI